MRTNPKGFTLIELMIAMVVGLIVMGGIVASYQSQQRSRTTQQMLVGMQQGARSAMALIRREIRMANYNPRRYNGVDDPAVLGGPANPTIDDAGESSVQGFLRVRPDSMRFTLDLNGNGDNSDDNEYITYGFMSGADTNGDGIADAGAGILGRENSNGAGLQNLAFDIQAIAFAYAVDDGSGAMLATYGGAVDDPVIWLQDRDGDGSLETHLDTTADGVIDESDTPGGSNVVGDGWLTSNPQVQDASAGGSQPVRAVQVWLLARTRAPVPGYLDTETYVVGGNHITPRDGYKRLLVTGIVKCRNPFQ